VFDSKEGRGRILIKNVFVSQGEERDFKLIFSFTRKLNKIYENARYEMIKNLKIKIIVFIVKFNQTR